MTQGWVHLSATAALYPRLARIPALRSHRVAVYEAGAAGRVPRVC
jgi:hypothetical protein